MPTFVQILLIISFLFSLSQEVRMANMDGTLIRNDSLYRVTEDNIFRHRTPDCLLLIGNKDFNLCDQIMEAFR